MPALERLYLGSGLHIQEELHLGRYRFACSRIGADATVLDAACGSGYGSGVLAQHARRVVAVDLSLDALAHARAHYPLPNIEFVRADLSEPIALPDCSCDAIVSFETLEHVRNQRVMLSEFRRILKPGGTLVLSSPDRDIITSKAHEVDQRHRRLVAASHCWPRAACWSLRSPRRSVSGARRFRPRPVVLCGGRT